ncbi:hypothetical protein [Microseira wollei]|uniref:DUF4347 domain-containing protein n=1 Tax=Microseira wollei NIES-4236 TaxID=2530354 RepID=A0AAV3XMQ5_9CYAN|nr:hypothetical protein [Microseira wollei]GET42071.1 hypothetical protein MiSe_68850 [Microseira wollei NIES-4236]
MNYETEIQRAFTPQERTGISLLPSFEPDIWVVVDGGHPAPLDAVGSGAGVVILQRSLFDIESDKNNFSLDWQQYSYALETSENSTNAEIFAAIKGLSEVANKIGQKSICLLSDNTAVNTLQIKLLVIELGLKNAQRYIKELQSPPLKELADLFLRSQPCKIISLQELQPEGFNIVLMAAHQAAHELATKAGITLRQGLQSFVSEDNSLQQLENQD